MSEIGPMFSIAAAFGNVHGVYQAGNVTLQPERLGKHQAYIKKQLGSDMAKPTFLVMHGGSGSSQDEIKCAVQNGVIKMNIDTDTQWAYWNGLREHYEGKTALKDGNKADTKLWLQGQIGNPSGPSAPNKKQYDPRVWIRKCEEGMIKRAKEAFESLNGKGSLGDDWTGV